LIFRGEYGIPAIPNRRLAIAETLQQAHKACQHGVRSVLGRPKCAGFRFYDTGAEWIEGYHEGGYLEDDEEENEDEADLEETPF
jgi:hypothetical protein